MKRILTLAVPALLFAAPAFGQSAERVEQRVREIDARLDLGVRTGALTPAEQQNLRDRLQAVRRNLQERSSDGLTPSQADQLLAQLDAIDSGIRRQARDAQSVSPNTSDSFAEFEQRLQSLSGRIDAGVADGSIRQDEATRIRANLDRLRERLQAARADGQLSREERQDLNTRFQVASGGIARQRNDSQVQR